MQRGKVRDFWETKVKGARPRELAVEIKTEEKDFADFVVRVGKCARGIRRDSAFSQIGLIAQPRDCFPIFAGFSEPHIHPVQQSGHAVGKRILRSGMMYERGLRFMSTRRYRTHTHSHFVSS